MKDEILKGKISLLQIGDQITLCRSDRDYDIYDHSSRLFYVIEITKHYVICNAEMNNSQWADVKCLKLHINLIDDQLIAFYDVFYDHTNCENYYISVKNEK